MAVVYLPHGNSIVDSQMTYVVQDKTCNSSIYSIGIYQELLVKFSCDLYETLTL